jgi:hypothetical protein
VSQGDLVPYRLRREVVLRRERRVGTKLEHHSIGLGRALNVRQLSTTNDGWGR